MKILNKKKNWNNNRKIISVALAAMVILLVSGGIYFKYSSNSQRNQPKFSSPDHAVLPETVMAEGEVEAEDWARLSFVNPGRVAYLGVAAGDRVEKGQVLAGLDTSILQGNATAAEASYRSSQAALNKVLDDIHLFQYGNGGFANVGTGNETQTQKTQRQQAEEAVNAAFDNWQNSLRQLRFASIVAPFSGTVSLVENMDPGTNSTLTSGSVITMIGEGNLKFVANVLNQDVSKIKLGQTVKISLDKKKGVELTGTVSRIANTNTSLPDGTSIVKVDIQSSALSGVGRSGEGGSAVIGLSRASLSLPSWVILGGKYVWVYSGEAPVLKTVDVGRVAGDWTEVISGLNDKDRIILDPELIMKNKYRL